MWLQSICDGPTTAPAFSRSPCGVAQVGGLYLAINNPPWQRLSPRPSPTSVTIVCEHARDPAAPTLTPSHPSLRGEATPALTKFKSPSNGPRCRPAARKGNDREQPRFVVLELELTAVQMRNRLRQ